jgi:hypothetical protein
VPDIFDEVEEELRAERARHLLTKYAGLIVAAALLVVVAVAGWQAWRWRQARQDEAAGASYVQAMLQVSTTGPTSAAARDAGLAGFSRLTGGATPDGYRTLARLRTAAILAATHPPQALAMWNEVAADPAADPLLRDLATLMWTQHQLDGGDPGILEARLRPLAQPNNPWHAMAEEQLALLALRQGKTAVARDSLTALTHDTTAPNGVRQRAAAVLAQLQG